MGGQDLNHWIKCTITMIHKTELTTKTISLTNRHAVEDTSPSSWPLIAEISRIGVASDREGLLNTSGEIRIIDAIGSFGVERKFSDLLQRYSIHDQVISIDYDSTEAGDYAPSGYADVFTGIIQDWRLAPDTDLPTISIRFKSKTFTNRYITKKINLVDFPSAPTKEYYKTLPVVIGSNIQVRPIQIAADGDGSPEYAYATTLGTQYGNGGVQAYYAKDERGYFQQVLSASAVGTAVIDSVATGLDASCSSYEVAAILKAHTETSNNYLLTQVDVKMLGGGASTYNGAISVNIYKGLWDATNKIPSVKVVASGTRRASDLDASFDLGTAFEVSFALDRPLPLAAQDEYWIGIRHVADGGAGMVSVRGVSSGTFPLHVRYAGGSWFSSGTNYALDFSAYGAKFTDTPVPASGQVNNEGKGHSYFEITQKTAITGYANPDLTSAEYAVEVNGLIDDSSGTLTGTPSAQLGKVRTAISALEQEWNGSTWAATGNWDFGLYSGTRAAAEEPGNRYSRTPDGATVGDTTFEAWLKDVCRNTASKPTLQRNGKIGLYYWGTNFSSVKTLTQENSTIKRVEALNTGYVLNRLSMAYFKKLVNTLGFTVLRVEQVPDNYALVLNWYDSGGTYPGIDYWIGESVTLYGEHPNANLYFDWIRTDQSAEAMAKYLLSNFNEPPIYVDVELPLATFNTFTSSELMNVVELKHPSLPCFFGSSPNTKLPHFEGTECDLSGYNLTRAARYRAQMEAAYIDFSEDMVPTVTLTTRLLLTDADPT